MKWALLRNRWFWVCVAICLAGGGGWVWLERASLQAWYCARQLAQAPAEQRGQWLEQLANLDVAAAPPLLRQLDSADEQARANCSWALIELGRRWRTDQARSLALLQSVHNNFHGLGPAGRGEVLGVLAAIGQGGGDDTDVPAGWSEAAGQLVVKAAEYPDAAGRGGALELALVLMQQERPASEVLGKLYATACRRLVETALRDGSVASRAVAVRLAASPELDLLDRIAPLAVGAKADPSPEVRSLALTAVAAHEELASTEELLPLLHDPDPEVRATCEHALRGRGLSVPHVQLARQMTDPQASIRARVPAQVQSFADLDTRLWLERLSRDPSPAVRAAVLRAAAETGEAQLTDRLRAMTLDDPSPTVRQIAAYYLRGH